MMISFEGLLLLLKALKSLKQVQSQQKLLYPLTALPFMQKRIPNIRRDEKTTYFWIPAAVL